MPRAHQYRPSITVVIAAFNSSAFLKRAVASALDQTFSPCEVLIVDDASTDDTVAVALGLGLLDERVRTLRQLTNGGPGIARNIGLQHAKGDWVAVLDADDAFEPNHLELVHSIAVNFEADVVLSNFLYFDPVASGSSRSSEAGLLLDGVTEVSDIAHYISHCAGLGSEADWGLLKPFISGNFFRDTYLRYPEKSRHGEDFLFICDSLNRGAKVRISRVPSYLYSLRSSGWSRTKINYELMISHTRELANSGLFAVTPAFELAIQMRIRSLRKIIARHTIASRRLAGKKTFLLFDALENRFVLLELGSMLWRKVSYLWRVKVSRAGHHLER